jgi:hypothetical protein
MKSKFTSMLRAVVPAITLFTLPLVVQADPLIVIVVTNGATAPDGIGTLSTFGLPVLNDAGQVAFIANLPDTGGVGPTNDSGVYRGDEFPGDLTQIVRTGQAAPTGGGLVFTNYFSTFDVPLLNNRGQVAFFGTLGGPGIGSTNNLGIFVGSGPAASLSNIVQTGQLTPDNNGRYSAFTGSGHFGYPPLNDAGQVAFFATITGATNINQTDGIFLGNGATRTQIARTWYPGPFGTFASYSLSDPALNNLGQVAFSAATTGGTNGNFRSDGSTLTRIAWALENTTASEPAPDVNGGLNGVLNYLAFQPSLNDAGQVAFITSFFATTNSPASSAGIVRGDGTPLVAIARTDELAPDGTNTLYSFWSNFASAGAALNNSGQVAFAATLDGATSWGIFRGGGTVASLTKIMLQGQMAPDTNLTFDAPGFATPAINDAGQVVFIAGLNNNGVRGIYFYDDKLGLLKVISTGDPLLGSTVQSVQFIDSDPYDGRPGSGLNNRGQVAFWFHLNSNKSGIAIWQALDFRITAIQAVTNDVRLTWKTLGGKTNVVQVTPGGPGGSYTNNFTDLASNIVVSGVGQVSTNYLDIDGATNKPARYYRIRLVP